MNKRYVIYNEDENGNIGYVFTTSNEIWAYDIHNMLMKAHPEYDFIVCIMSDDEDAKNPFKAKEV